MDLLLHIFATTAFGGLILKILLNALALMAAASFLKGVEINNFFRAIMIAIVLGILNATIGVALDFLSAPLRFITIGLFSFVVDAVVILIAAKGCRGKNVRFMKDFKVSGFGSAILLALLLGVFNFILNGIFL